VAQPQVTLSIPGDLQVRLTRVAELTGVPESTLREAIYQGELRGAMKKNSWHTTLDNYNAWIEAPSQPRRNRRATAERPLQSVHEERGSKDQRECGDQNGSADRPEKKAKKPVARRKIKPLVYELCPFVDE